MSEIDVRRRPDVARLFRQTESDMPEHLARETHRVALRLFSEPEAQGPCAPGDRLGPYRVERLLGLGGQAHVYEAVHTQLERRVALKVPRPEAAEQLLEEGRLAARLEHPRVVRVEDVAADADPPYLVMEHCAGGSLEERLERSPEGLPLDEVRDVARAVLEALAYAHERGVVHRDVKPANVLFDERGGPKLADLGIGAPAGPAAPLDHSVQLTGQGPAAIAGTPLFMAPEQERPDLLAGGELDGRADLFAFGKVLFFILTGASPRTIRPPSRLRRGLHPAWDELVFGLVEEERERRFPDAAAALRVLDAIPAEAALETLAPAAPTPEGEGEGEAAAPGAAVVPGREGRARSVFGAAALLFAAFLGFLEVAHPVAGGDPWGVRLLGTKAGAALAALFLAWFRRRERKSAAATATPNAVLLSALLGGWVPALYGVRERIQSSGLFAFEEVSAVLLGVTFVLGFAAGFSLWSRPRVRRAQARAEAAAERRTGVGRVLFRILALVLGVAGLTVVGVVAAVMVGFVLLARSCS